MFVLSIYYLFKALFSQAKADFPVNSKNNIKRVSLAPIKHNVIYGIYTILVTYVMLSFFLNSPGIYEMWSDRMLASIFMSDLNETYKIQFVFAVSTTIIVYLTLANSRNIYIIMFSPFVLLDIMSTDRDFMYQAMMISLCLLLLTRTKIPILKLVVFSLFIISIEMIRVSWQGSFEFRKLLFIPGELLLTKEAEYLIIESKMSTDLFNLLIYSFGKALSPQVMNNLFGGVPNFREIIDAESQLHFGLGGSLLSEVFSIKNYLLYIIYPFIVIIYLEIINVFRCRFGFIGILIFIFYLSSTHSVFRSGIIFTSTEPIYYAMYATSWYWIIRMSFPNRIRTYYCYT
jgi:hypothetical protein